MLKILCKFGHTRFSTRMHMNTHTHTHVATNFVSSWAPFLLPLINRGVIVIERIFIVVRISKSFNIGLLYVVVR